MKPLFFYIFIVSLAISNAATAARISTKNVKGVLITFLETSEIETSDIETLAIETIKNTLSQEVLMEAMSLEGVKYKYGGSSPEKGFDCSGFVNYVFNAAANVKLPRTTGGLSRIGEAVDKQDLQAGDLVFFNTRRSAFSHVGIYISDGEFIHAPRKGGHVRIESMDTGYWQQHFNGAKRIDESGN